MVIDLKRLSPHSTGKAICGESRTYGLEGVVEGAPLYDYLTTPNEDVSDYQLKHGLLSEYLSQQLKSPMLKINAA